MDIKSFVVLAGLRRSMSRVCGAHFRFIASTGITASFEEMLQRWWAVDNTVSNLTGPRFESQPYRLRVERVITKEMT